MDVRLGSTDLLLGRYSFPFPKSKVVLYRQRRSLVRLKQNGRFQIALLRTASFFSLLNAFSGQTLSCRPRVV